MCALHCANWKCCDWPACIIKNINILSLNMYILTQSNKTWLSSWTSVTQHWQNLSSSSWYSFHLPISILKLQTPKVQISSNYYNSLALLLMVRLIDIHVQDSNVVLRVYMALFRCVVMCCLKLGYKKDIYRPFNSLWHFVLWSLHVHKWLIALAN